MTDRDVLRAFKKDRSLASFQPLVERYSRFVYASAYRRLGDEADAAAAAMAVFQVLANRARKLPRKTVLAVWLFRASRLATARVIKTRPRRTSPAPDPAPASPLTLSLSERVMPLLDRTLDRLRPRLQQAVLVQVLLNEPASEAARLLRIRPARLARRTTTGLTKLARRLQKCGVPVAPESLREVLTASVGLPAPETLNATILSGVEEYFRRKPETELARATLRALAWFNWKRRLKRAGIACAALLLFLGLAALYLNALWRSGQLFAWLIEFSARQQAKQFPEASQPARPWPPADGPMPASAAAVESGADLYRGTNIWLVRLTFSADQWAALSPTRVPPLRDMMQKDGTILLRNPQARRSGLAGVLGYEFNWVHAGLNFGGTEFGDVATRYKGNGTYIGSLYGVKRSFKIDLNKFDKHRQLGGVDTLNFINVIEDSSYMSDALGYELFRNAGVPAPRTAYAWLSVSVENQWPQRPFGLYLMVENVDADFAADRFGSKKTPVFKPVTYDLFKDLGDAWSAYAPIYDLKTKASAAQLQRVIDLAKLVTHADDPEFAARVGEFVDLDEFARFLGVLVLLASYDGFLSNGQNFYMYLHPDSNRFGFIPWDLDHAWGGFPFIGTSQTRERASIWKPWVNRNRFLERLLSVEEFRAIYRTRMKEMLDTLFVPDRLWSRIDQVAGAIHSPIAAESDFRLKRFDQAVSTNWITGPRDGEAMGPKKPIHQLKRYILNRAQSVRDQLDGKSDGIVLRMGGPNGR